MATKTLRIQLADILGPLATNATDTEVQAWALYVDGNGRPMKVRLTDGTVIVPNKRTFQSSAAGVIDIPVVPNDDATVLADDQGFGVRVGWDVKYRSGGRDASTHSEGEIVEVSTSDPSIVQFGLKAPYGPIVPGATYPSDAEIAATYQTKADATAALSTYETKANVAAGDAAKVDLARVGISQPASNSIADLQAAANAAATNGYVFRAAGTVTTSTTLTITSDCDLGGLTINYTGTGTAIQVGNGTVLRRKRLVLPNVVEANKPATGWNAGTVGVRLTNTSDCKIRLSNVQNFEKGVICWGQGNEFSYNEVSVAGLNNNKVNLTLDADATGWVNANVFIAGRYSHNSGEGAQVAGCYHIYLADVLTSRPNGNVWVNASLESPNVVQYALNIESGQYNQFVGCRWEDTSGAPRVRWGAKAIQNMIEGGYFADQIAHTKVTGSARNIVFSADRFEMQGAANPMMRLENSGSSAQGSIAIYNAGTLSTAYTAASDWSTLLSATQFRMKAKTDTNDRFQVDTSGRKVTLGAGVSSSASSITWGSGSPEGVITAPIGATYHNYAGTGFGRYAKGSGTGNTGWQAVGFQPFTTAGRPAASLAGVGGAYFDTTLNKPLWSDGTAWRDATGTIV